MGAIRNIAALALAAVLLVSVPLLALAESDPLVWRVIMAYGGPEGIIGKSSWRGEGFLMPLGAERAATVVREFKSPGMFRVQIEYDDRDERRLLDGDVGWQGDLTRLSRSSGMQTDGMVFHLLRSNIPTTFNLYGSRMKRLDSGETGNSPVTRLLLEWSDRLMITFWVNLESCLVERVDADMRKGDNWMRMSTELSDFREVEGVLMAYRETSFMGKTFVGVTQFDRFELNPDTMAPFDPKEF